jgi:hypothetical protein
MGDVRPPFPASLLLDGAARIHRDPLTPLNIPASTFAFLHRLAPLCDGPSKPLAQSLVSLPYSAVEEELIRMLVPKNVQELRNIHERFQLDKELAISEQDFDRARLLLDAQDGVKLQIERLYETFPDVEPRHVVDALRNLGFEGSLDV